MPEDFSTQLTYDEKLEVFETLIDGLHDLNEFKTFLNQRIEERSAFNKQKLELYQEIKSLEA
jgi:predicted HicB family RNase H-like nuclease